MSLRNHRVSRCKYTRGPWVMDPDDIKAVHGQDFFGPPGDEDGYHIITSQDWHISGFVGYSNALLIHAAPDLLEALVFMIEQMSLPENAGHTIGSYLHGIGVHNARAAIAKATEMKESKEHL